MQNKPDDFFQKVYRVVRQIPPGRVTSYGAIAKFVGSPQSSRMVGWAMNASHAQSEFVPAHRVVNRLGMLTGKHHFGYPDAMGELLKSEGAIIENDKITNFSDMFWQPGAEPENDKYPR